MIDIKLNFNKRMLINNDNKGCGAFVLFYTSYNDSDKLDFLILIFLIIY